MTLALRRTTSGVKVVDLVVDDLRRTRPRHDIVVTETGTLDQRSTALLQFNWSSAARTGSTIAIPDGPAK